MKKFVELKYNSIAIIEYRHNQIEKINEIIHYCYKISEIKFYKDQYYHRSESIDISDFDKISKEIKELREFKGSCTIEKWNSFDYLPF